MRSDQAISFGPFRLDPSARLLLRDGKPVRIGGRALDILIVLAARAGEVVSKRDLFASVWSEVNVDEGSLRFHMMTLRKALGDGKSGARFVTNIPGRGYCLVTPISRAVAPGEAGVKARVADRPRTLPARLSRMVGRDDAVQRIVEAVVAHRFVTIVGPGGIGKTTVATAAGHVLEADFPNLIWFVDLGSLSEPKLVPGAVASTLGLMVGSDDPIASLVASVRDMRLLLILDGCEHVIETVAPLAETLFEAAPSIHILATGRESLRVEGEHVYRLVPLQCPPQDEALGASDVLDFPAAQLFVERATAAAGEFELTDAEAGAVTSICHRLDGIPLALEIVAARADAFGIKELAARLDDRLLLTTKGRRTAIPRHQTLRATLDWSYERLPRSEQILLNRLSIFNGVFTLGATSAVCAGDGLSESDIPEGIFDLVAKSLVSVSLGREALYRLLDTTRFYAGEKLEGEGEREVLAERHARYTLALFESAVKQWEERPSPEWLATYRRQIDNLRVALRWALSEGGDPALGVALTIAAVPLWSQLSQTDESLDWVERALAASARLPQQDRYHEMQLHAALAGLQMYAISSAKQSNNAWEMTLKIATELGEIDYQLRALRALWAEAINAGEFVRALSWAEQFQQLASKAGSDDDQIVADRLIGTAQHFLGEQDKAHVAIERMLDRYVNSAARSQVVRFQFNQKVSARLVRGRILWLRGQTESALRDVAENVAEALTLDHTMSVCNVLTQSACPIALLAGAFDIAQHYVEILCEHTESRALDIWHTYAICFDAGLDIERGDVERGLDRLQPAMEELRRSGFGHYRTSFLMMRARALLMLNRAADAGATMAEAISICDRTGERWCLAELHRLSGEIALSQGGSQGLEPALAAFHRALRIAQEQQAIAWELRAATSLTRYAVGDRRMEEACGVLRQIYDQFSEGHDGPELMEAAALLEPRQKSAS